MTTAPLPVTQVAVGVLVRDDGAVLLADRPAGKPYAGYWEFPGGKIEPCETVGQALARELAEELGVTVGESQPWVTMEYDYPHAYVRLHFRRIHDWRGVPRSVEGQQLRFLAPGDAPPAPLLPAAVPAMRWIQLPTVTGFTPGTAVRADEVVAWLQDMLGRGLRQVIWDEPLLDAAQRRAALGACRDLASAHAARLLVRGDGSAGRERAGAALEEGPDIYLETATLRACDRRPTEGWLGAAVQTADDLARAARIGCDFAVLDVSGAGPGTPQRIALATLCADAPLPVYVVSEAGLASLRAARGAGAHGLALRPAGP